ncbi:MAG: hypothetical protein LBS18_07545 [Clostridiales bacterium]|jgi:hypothetical protein|nr:hypothetical protein [Clostridiales bacterium]
MPLWLAALLFIVFAGALAIFLFLSARKKNKARLIAGACVIGAVLLALAGYIALTFVLVEGIP